MNSLSTWIALERLYWAERFFLTMNFSSLLEREMVLKPGPVLIMQRPSKQGLVLEHVGAVPEDPVDLNGHWRAKVRPMSLPEQTLASPGLTRGTPWMAHTKVCG